MINLSSQIEKKVITYFLVAQITEVPKIDIINPEEIDNFLKDKEPEAETYWKQAKKIATHLGVKVSRLIAGKVPTQTYDNPLDTYCRQILESAYIRAGHPDLLASTTGHVIIQGKNVGSMLKDMSNQSSQMIKQQFRDLPQLWEEDKTLTLSERNLMGSFKDSMILGMTTPTIKKNLSN